MARTTFRDPGNRAISNQVVQRDGTVNYAPISTNAYAQQSSDAYNQTFQNSGDYQELIAKLATQMERNSPTAQADAYAARRTADAEYLKAQSMMNDGQGAYGKSAGSGSSRIRIPGEQSKPAYSPFDTMIANEQARKAQIPIGYGNSFDDVTYRRVSERNANEAVRLYGKEKMYDQAAGQAQRDLDKYIAQLGSSDTRYLGNLDSGDKRYVTDTQSKSNEKIAQTQQPLSSGDILEKTRIENPPDSSTRNMAMGLLGGYATGNNARSNFAYWG